MKSIFTLVKNVFKHTNTEQEKADRLYIIRQYQTLYKTPMGRAVLDDILTLCKYGSSPLGDSTEETYFNLGEQNVGLEIASILNADLSKLEEANNEQIQS